MAAPKAQVSPKQTSAANITPNQSTIGSVEVWDWPHREPDPLGNYCNRFRASNNFKLKLDPDTQKVQWKISGALDLNTITFDVRKNTPISSDPPILLGIRNGDITTTDALRDSQDLYISNVWNQNTPFRVAIKSV